MITNNVHIKGSLNLLLKDSAGNVVKNETVENLIVTTGLNFVASRLGSGSAAVMSHMAVGTDATSASAGQTTLVTEVARVALTSATVTNNTIAYVADFPAGIGTGTLVEAGIFNDPTAGTMLNRTASINVTKGATDTLTITWTVTVS